MVAALPNSKVIPLYASNTRKFVRCLPFISEYEYRSWEVLMGHIDGLTSIEELVQIQNSQNAFTREECNLKLERYLLSYVMYCWLELIRTRRLIVSDSAEEILIPFIEFVIKHEDYEVSKVNKRFINNTVKVFFSKLQNTNELNLILNEIKKLYLGSGYSLNEFNYVRTIAEKEAS